jgi:hypothetical protein
MFSTPVGLALASDPRLTARMFRIVLLVYANLDGEGEAALGNEQIAAATGLNERDVRRAIADMRGLGILSARVEGKRRLLRPSIGRGGVDYPGGDHPGADRPPSPSAAGDPSRGANCPPLACNPEPEAGEIAARGEGHFAPPMPPEAGASHPGVAAPPRVPPPAPPSSRPPVCVPGVSRAVAGEEPFEQGPGASPAFSRASGPGRTPEELEDRRAAQEFAEQFAPQLAYRVRELLAVYPGALVLYALQEAAAKGKVRGLQYALGVCRQRLADGWSPPPRASPPATASAATPAGPPPPPAQQPQRPSRNAARQQDALERYRRFRAEQEAAAKETAT